MAKRKRSKMQKNKEEPKQEAGKKHDDSFLAAIPPPSEESKSLAAAQGVFSNRAIGLAPAPDNVLSSQLHSMSFSSSEEISSKDEMINIDILPEQSPPVRLGEPRNISSTERALPILFSADKVDDVLLEEIKKSFDSNGKITKLLKAFKTRVEPKGIWSVNSTEPPHLVISNEREDRLVDSIEQIGVLMEDFKPASKQSASIATSASTDTELIFELHKAPEASLKSSFEKYINRGKILYGEESERARTESTSPTIALEFHQFLDGEFKEKVQIGYRPFLFVVASSGMGKTQLAFTLPSKLVYLSFSSDALKQDISKYFEDFTEFIWKVACQDLYRRRILTEGRSIGLQEYRKVLPEVSLGRIRSYSFLEPLLLMGFFVQLFRSRNWDHVLDPYTLSTFKFSAQTRSSIDGNPIFILDEYHRTGYEQKIVLAFIRNTLRALDARVIVMGTNCSAMNLFYAGGSGSRPEETLHPWCYVWDKLPICSTSFDDQMANNADALINAIPSLQDTLKMMLDCVSSERPLMHVYMSDFIILVLANVEYWKSEVASKGPVWFFNAFIDYLYQRLFAAKNAIEIENSTSKAYAFGIDAKNKVLGFDAIHSHFAQFACQPAYYDTKNLYVTTYIQNKYVGVYNHIRTFSPIGTVAGSRFRAFDTEPFLRLALTGWRNLNWSASPRNFLELLIEGNKVANVATKVDQRNEKRDGSLLEVAGRLALAQASRIHGFSGVSFKEYLLQLAQSIFSYDIVQIVSSAKGSYLDARIPFMGPIGGKWNKNLAQWCNIHGIPIASTISPCDKLRSDFIVFDGIDKVENMDRILNSKLKLKRKLALILSIAIKLTAEMKNRVENLTLVPLKQIVKRTITNFSAPPDYLFIFVINIGKKKELEDYVEHNTDYVLAWFSPCPIDPSKCVFGFNEASSKFGNNKKNKFIIVVTMSSPDIAGIASHDLIDFDQDTFEFVERSGADNLGDL